MVNPELDSVRIVEIEFGEVTVRMLLAAMLIDADHDPSRPRPRCSARRCMSRTCSRIRRSVTPTVVLALHKA